METKPGQKTATSLRPLQLAHGSLEHTLLVTENLYFRASQLRDEFRAALPPSTEDYSGDRDEPSSRLELAAQFLGHLAGRVERTDDPEAGLDKPLLNCALDDFETTFLEGNDVHAAVASLPSGSNAKALAAVRSYYAARLAADRPLESVESNLFRAAAEGKATLFAVFGGQGNTETYFDELSDLYTTYRPFVDSLFTKSAELLQSLAADARTQDIYNNGFDVLKWLQDPSTRPETAYLVSAPVSFPLIGLLHFVYFCVIAKVLGKHPGELRDCLKGATGHSQGIVTAVAIASSSSWESFDSACSKALTVLFWIGVRSQQTFPQTSLAPRILEDSVANGEGAPTPMLAVRGLSKSAVEGHVAAVNAHLPEDRHVHISLVNGPRNIVVSGPPVSLYGLNLRLRKFKASSGSAEQNRVPYSQRKIRFTSSFLPITAPFHSPHLESAESRILDDLRETRFVDTDLAISVLNTCTGADLKARGEGTDQVPLLVRLIIRDPVHWEQATAFSQATHIVDFGPGHAAGVGVLTQRNKDGTGVRIILAGSLTGDNRELGYQAELFDRGSQKTVKYAVNWAERFAPRLTKTKAGKTYVDTKMSRLLGLPPVMVAGMTPTTCAWDFVAAAMNAGYHIELAGGGYFEPKSMERAIRRIVDAVTPGRRLGINLIYVNPAAIAWQIPLVTKLRAEGVPIGGITIGAGVPSLEVANEYIRNIGLEHIGFKPGSVDGILQVVEIARANPDFPVLLQWTGGRGGGHHSFEDFHQPILQTYSRIRQCRNIVLVAGSGFGGADDTHDYLTGKWAERHGFPAMPFDGLLFGSRVMTSKEAHTSADAKKAIAEAAGVDDAEWEKTYKGPAGGVITVRSEMGEPIHKLATRGVLFWAEMDRAIFSLDKAKRVPELKKQRDHIIKKLNEDFAKPWFGKNSAGKPVDLEDMTYAEVLRRMVELMFIEHQSRWLDVTLRRLTGDFVRRIEERFIGSKGVSVLQSYAELDEPAKAVDKILKAYPEAEKQLINAQDVQHFLLLCLRPIQKPVPFVPALDENFELWFKKDSLWQSEDLDAVVGRDVGRVCILQGPVAVKYSTTIDQPVKEILDGIHEGHIEKFLRDVYGGEQGAIPLVEYFGGRSRMARNSSSETTAGTKYHFAGIVHTNVGSLLEHLGGETRSWRHALFNTDTIMQGHTVVSSPFSRIFSLATDLTVESVSPSAPDDGFVIKERTKPDSKYLEVAQIKRLAGDELSLTLFHYRPSDSKPVGLELKFSYQPENGFGPIREVMDGRNGRIKDFYNRLWFDGESLAGTSVGDTFECTHTVTAQEIIEFVRCVGNNGESFVKKPGRDLYAPMDFGIVISWKAIMKPLLAEDLDGDLLKLVHLSNCFKTVPGATPFRDGDSLSTKARITAIVNQDAGLLVEVSATIARDSQAVMDVTSRFFYRGGSVAYEQTFEEKTEKVMKLDLESKKDALVLRSQEWFHLDVDGDSPMADLTGEALTFRLRSTVKFAGKDVFSSVKTTGQVLLELASNKIVQIASVDYTAGKSHSNPVIDYLQRKGHPVEEPVMFDNALSLNHMALGYRAPLSNEIYASASGDYNPIHVSHLFAGYAELPNTITHGMYSSAAVRALVETWAADNDIGRFKSFDASFLGMVSPNDDIQVDLWHVGMIEGRKIIKVEAFNRTSDEKVLEATAEIDEPLTSYVFTGQGSQEQGMGMDLYATSKAAADVWDRADKHLLQTYGFSIIDIVRRNPKELTVHFGGAEGNAIRQNYMNMTIETQAADGTVKLERVIKEIDDETDSYTYRSPNGLLFSTQFAQPALTLMEKASFEDMRARGLIPKSSYYAGHSLGEYAALGSLGDFMPIENLVTVVFYRGLAMQLSMERDESGRTNYSMCSVNPSRISKEFTEKGLRAVVETIQTEMNCLLEIVNLNIINQQYICAGDLRALDVLTEVTTYLKTHKFDLQGLGRDPIPADTKAQLLQLIHDYAKKTEAKPRPLELSRGAAAIPLRGIDVPFHSSFLRYGVGPYRSFLDQNISKAGIDPRKLIGKYIPNLTAKPFQITREYFEDTYNLTKSPRLEKILANWDRYKVLEARTLETQVA